MTKPPHGTIAHFAINSDDLTASLAFYEALFGWKLDAWGPPGFYRTERPGAPTIDVAIQERRDLLAQKTLGFEVTVAVDDVHATVALALALGGRVAMEPVTIPTVCELAMLEDPSGNVVGVARYFSEAE